MRLELRILLLALMLVPILGGCARVPAGNIPSVALALDGPALYVVGEYDGIALEGTMDRKLMVGIGDMALASIDPGAEFSCTATVDEPPTEKARVRGMLDCSGDKLLYFSLRNLGPDQGVGIGRTLTGGPLLMFFYHPSKEEALRRFPGIKEDMRSIDNKKSAPVWVPAGNADT